MCLPITAHTYSICKACILIGPEFADKVLVAVAGCKLVVTEQPLSQPVMTAHSHGVYNQTTSNSYEATSDDGMAYQRCQPPLGGATQAHLLLSYC